MFNNDFIEKLSKRFSETIPPSVHTFKDDLERNFKSILQSAFAKFDFVTREEFDVQAKVLAKTRTKLETLEKHIAALEQTKKSSTTGQKATKRSQSDK